MISSESIIRQLKLPVFIFPIRILWKNVLNFGHNLIIIPIVFIPFSTHIGPVMLLSILGFALLTLNLMWMVTILSIACARFRDLGPIVNSLVTIAYFLTPIMWQPSSLGNSSLAHLLLGLNPLYHLIQICRQPLVGMEPTLENWVGALLLLIVGGLLTKVVYKIFSPQIPFWI
jgi:lipopolysaccharide transport system permease protein